jgi:hypothetical protein
MAANSSLILSNLDFDTLKNTLKQYMRSQDKFNDYDFDGSNMNVLLDLLAYNTYHNAFYLNMIGNEMFMDTAVIRDSVVSHAKELNYVPRSFKSAEANVSIIINSTDASKRSITMPKGTSFTSRFGQQNFTFTTGENIVISDVQINANDTVTFTGNNISLYEGYYVTDTFTFRSDNGQQFQLTNKNVDTSSISVTVIEDVGATTLTYTRASSLFDLAATSQVFFVQGAESDSYEIVFGDGVTGRRPKDNSIIVVEYRISNGQLPNGCDNFYPDSTIGGESNIAITVNTKASGGSVSESIESIKYNAPRHFTTQERAITAEDYENLLKINFPEINAVAAYGGENLNPPQFGKVFVAVDLNEVDGLPESKRNEYYRFLKPRSPVSIDPVFVDPEYTYINIISSIKYNINTTRLTADDVNTLAKSAILQYAATELNNFNRVFRYSKLVSAIDTSQTSIVSNETQFRLVKVYNPTIVGASETFDIKFNLELDKTPSQVFGANTLQSSRFTYITGQKAYIKDDGNGTLAVHSVISDLKITDIGTINYETGLVQIANFAIIAFENAGIKFYAVPRFKDVTTLNNVILNIIEEDVVLTIVPVRQ